jgi:hypothetical protein
MKRHDTGPAKAKVRSMRPENRHHIVAVHGAGQAVAKLLVAKEMGYRAGEALKYIEIRWPLSENTVGPQAVTHGPMFSSDIAAAADEFKRNFRAERPTTTHVVQKWEAQALFAGMVKTAKAAGVDVEKWFRAKALMP